MGILHNKGANMNGNYVLLICRTIPSYPTKSRRTFYDVHGIRTRKPTPMPYVIACDLKERKDQIINNGFTVIIKVE